MVYKLLRLGELAAVRIGRLPRVESTALDAYLDRQRAVGGRSCG